MGGLSEKTLARLERSGNIRTFRDGETIHLRGDPGDSIGVVLSGAVALSNTGSRGKRFIYGVLPRGRFYGVYALMTRSGRTYDASASGDTAVAMVGLNKFHLLLNEDAGFREEVVLTLAGQIEYLGRTLDDERRLSLKARIGQLLVRACSRETGEVDLTQTQIAQHLAVSRNAAGMALGELAQQGFVELGYGQILVLSREALKHWILSQAELAPV
ncbi:MAG: Crp/Fnr family transcriptional regulator [Hyphomonadaceae bacterium]